MRHFFIIPKLNLIGVEIFDELRYAEDMVEIITRSPQEMQKIAAGFAKEAAQKTANSALVIALEGELGSGKTTFVQGFAKAIGIEEKVLSPTFVLMKIYSLKQRRSKHLVHIDCYRLESAKDLLHLGFRKILKDKDAIILIEWADKIRRILPHDAIWISFCHGKRSQERIISIEQ